MNKIVLAQVILFSLNSLQISPQEKGQIVGNAADSYRAAIQKPLSTIASVITGLSKTTTTKSDIFLVFAKNQPGKHEIKVPESVFRGNEIIRVLNGRIA